MKRFIYFLFALLGFGAVACDNGMHDQVAEYGCPTVHFSLKARVVDEAGKPIEGIEVQTKDNAFYADNYSDAEGNIDLNGSMWPDTNIDLVFTDVDGAENGGEFEEKTVELDFSNIKYTADDDAWYWGKKSLEQDIVLEEKVSNEE